MLAPYMAQQGIYLSASIIGKPGQKGGNIQFDRAQRDIENFLIQRSDTYVSTMFDYFRIDPRWPGLDQVRNPKMNSTEKAEIIENATKEAILSASPNCNPSQRFIPYIQMHEFEALLFSDSQILSSEIEVESSSIEAILNRYHNEPEMINQDPENAPSKQLARLNNTYKKVIQGTTISRRIGINQIRLKCPNFNKWLACLENLS